MARLYLLVSVLFISCQYCLSQHKDSNPSSIYDLNKQRHLVHVVGQYLFDIHQWQIDYDSTIIMACKGERLSHALYRNETFDDGSTLPGSDLIENRNLIAAERLLTTLKGTERIKLLLQLGAYYLFKPGFNARDSISTYVFLNQALSLSDSIGILKWKNASRTLLAKFYFQAGDFAKSKSLFTQVVDACSKAGDKNALANALANRGVYALFNDTTKLTDISRAREQFRSTNDTIGEIEMTTRIAQYHFAFGLFDETEKDELEAVRMEKEIGFVHLHYYYDVLAFFEQVKGNYNNALFYANSATAIMEQTNDRTFASLLFYRIANVYGGVGDFAKTYYWLRKSISISSTKLDSLTAGAWLAITMARWDMYENSLDYVDSILVLFPNPEPLTKMYLELARGLSYYGLHQVSLAEKHFSFAAAIADQLASQPQMSHDIFMCYVNIAWFYGTNSDKEKAKYFLRRTRQFNPVLTDFYLQALAAETQFKIDSSEGNYIPAIKSYQKANAVYDSIFSLRQARDIEELGIQYGVAQKEKDMQLMEKQQQLQQVQLQREKLTRNIIIIATVLLAFLFALLYNRYRIKQRYNKEMDKKNAALENLLKEKDALIEDKDGLLTEKEWLVKEIHHRVKNNLQMIISLLNAQSEFLDHPSAVNAIRESRERMQAIAIIHQRLYKLDGNSRIDMRSYISELLDSIRFSLTDSNRIRFQQEVADISLDISQSVPLGLILNEAITNAIKYAYSKDQSGIVNIKLQSLDPGRLQLIITDHGKGLPKDLAIASSNSLGLQLIKLFAEQLEGELHFINENGLTILLNFRVSDYSDSVHRPDNKIISSPLGN